MAELPDFVQHSIIGVIGGRMAHVLGSMCRSG